MMDVKSQFEQICHLLRRTKAWNHYSTDRDNFEQPDLWRRPAIDDEIWSGDCEDWSMYFADELQREGWPEDKIWLALCRKNNGQDHMVCLAETNHGHFALDCMHAYPQPPRSRRLRIKKWFAASPLNHAAWRAIDTPSGPLPSIMKNGVANSEFMTFGRVLRPHPRHILWLQTRTEGQENE